MRALALALLLCAPAAGQEDEPEILGRSSAGHLRLEASAESVLLPAGSRLRLHPSPSAPLLEILAFEISAEVEERAGGWVRVRVGGWRGWVRLEGVDDGPLTSLADGEAAAVRLERVRSLLGPSGRQEVLGPFRLLTDVRDAELLARLGALAAGIEAAYRRRFGLELPAGTEESVALLAREADYRRFEEEDLKIAGLETEGHTARVLLETPAGLASSTLSATFVGERGVGALEQTIIHELTHLLTRRLAAGRIPPWLEEGMAEDLALSRIGDDGRLVLGSFSGVSGARSFFLAGGSGGVRRRLSGGRAALGAVLATWRHPSHVDVETLTRLPWRALVATEQRAVLYAQSAMVVRFLLDGAGEETSRDFLLYLKRLGAGSADLDLWSALDLAPGETEQALYLWLRGRAAALGVASS